MEPVATFDRILALGDLRPAIRRVEDVFISRKLCADRGEFDE